MHLTQRPNICDDKYDFQCELYIYECFCIFLIRIAEYFYSTHLPQVPHFRVSESGQHWFRYWLVAFLAPSHYLNQCWVIVRWILRNKLQCNWNWNTKCFIQKSIWNFACEMTAILSSGDELTLVILYNPKTSTPHKQMSNVYIWQIKHCTEDYYWSSI